MYCIACVIHANISWHVSHSSCSVHTSCHVAYSSGRGMPMACRFVKMVAVLSVPQVTVACPWRAHEERCNLISLTRIHVSPGTYLGTSWGIFGSQLGPLMGQNGGQDCSLGTKLLSAIGLWSCRGVRTYFGHRGVRTYFGQRCPDLCRGVRTYFGQRCPDLCCEHISYAEVSGLISGTKKSCR